MTIFPSLVHLSLKRTVSQISVEVCRSQPEKGGYDNPPTDVFNDLQEAQLADK